MDFNYRLPFLATKVFIIGPILVALLMAAGWGLYQSCGRGDCKCGCNQKEACGCAAHDLGGKP